MNVPFSPKCSLTVYACLFAYLITFNKDDINFGALCIFFFFTALIKRFTVDILVDRHISFRKGLVLDIA